jgi:hypothetical protein
VWRGSRRLVVAVVVVVQALNWSRHLEGLRFELDLGANVIAEQGPGSTFYTFWVARHGWRGHIISFLRIRGTSSFCFADSDRFRSSQSTPMPLLGMHARHNRSIDFLSFICTSAQEQFDLRRCFYHLCPNGSLVMRWLSSTSAGCPVDSNG